MRISNREYSVPAIAAMYRGNQPAPVNEIFSCIPEKRCVADNCKCADMSLASFKAVGLSKQPPDAQARRFRPSAAPDPFGGEGAPYERPKRNNLPTTLIDDRSSGPSTYQAGGRGAHQADAGRTDPADVAAVVDTQRPQLPCLCGHDHV